jgi:hypothetical protein
MPRARVNVFLFFFVRAPLRERKIYLVRHQGQSERTVSSGGGDQNQRSRSAEKGPRPGAAFRSSSPLKQYAEGTRTARRRRSSRPRSSWQKAPRTPARGEPETRRRGWARARRGARRTSLVGGIQSSSPDLTLPVSHRGKEATRVARSLLMPNPISLASSTGAASVYACITGELK